MSRQIHRVLSRPACTTFSQHYYGCQGIYHDLYPCRTLQALDRGVIKRPDIIVLWARLAQILATTGTKEPREGFGSTSRRSSSIDRTTVNFYPLFQRCLHHRPGFLLGGPRSAGRRGCRMDTSTIPPRCTHLARVGRCTCSSPRRGLARPGNYLPGVRVVRPLMRFFRASQRGRDEAGEPEGCRQASAHQPRRHGLSALAQRGTRPSRAFLRKKRGLKMMLACISDYFWISDSRTLRGRGAARPKAMMLIDHNVPDAGRRGRERQDGDVCVSAWARTWSS